ncbi:flagellar biosynthetic protein FliP, partial [Paracoccaceae bacterium]|nr:flagellar biosynthetic protein FliP [Paracoccaceae bacterium]
MIMLKTITFIVAFCFIIFSVEHSVAQSGLSNFAEGLPALKIQSNNESETTYSLSLQILALMTGLTLLPSLVLGATSFTRIIIVLSILRQAMGTQQTPPNQVLIAIALFLTFFIMTPTLTEINKTALDPYLEGEMPAKSALSTGSNTLKEFLVKNTRENDLSMFTDLIGDQGYSDPKEIPLTVIL